ncbi:hypothetical protein [Allorhodopirellula solitaria]|uniref:Uncharacterized protein n=1 Tax=Allorhodopirellula solitaria TaxID=2527987 RepID=A0A5C5YBG4_9BACT|nr:hypothetical protein [Allorhodopirellula solitaria]TWT73047.1 hypothetical protein CA85_15130 [Allorhodopirellula solitaria]
MALSFYRRGVKAIWQRSISSVLLLVLLLGLTGVPLSRPVPTKEGRFPCEHCPCGCTDADFCWDRCCCHSDAEKLQWANDNGVKAPDFLVARAARESSESDLATAPAADEKSCGRCCGQTCSDRPAEPAAATPTSLRLLSLQSVSHCRGIDLVWTLLSSAVLDVPPSGISRPDPPLLYRLPLLSESAPSMSESVDPPVP